ncbi:hypothetical protein O3G_MSEX002042 [Manduca sexta]|uniref:Uncharacterized protein n=1 Tax=Manduca sexta TaxID=7130 RepID=A0A922CCI8_MANSE|nr:hypothetical protein O3G_MSEX002042 [Manduca sexta]
MNSGLICSQFLTATLYRSVQLLGQDHGFGDHYLWNAGARQDHWLGDCDLRKAGARQDHGLRDHNLREAGARQDHGLGDHGLRKAGARQDHGLRNHGLRKAGARQDHGLGDNNFRKGRTRHDDRLRKAGVYVNDVNGSGGRLSGGNITTVHVDDDLDQMRRLSGNVNHGGLQDGGSNSDGG